MEDRKLWHWQITIVNGAVSGVSARPIDYSTATDIAEVSSMHIDRNGRPVVEVEVVAETRTSAERLALDVVRQDVPEDMQGR